MSVNSIRHNLCYENLAKILAIATIFFIPLSNSFTVVISTVCGILSLCMLNKKNLQDILKSHVTIAILIFLCLHILGMIYSIGADGHILQSIRKMSRLLLIPIFFPLFQDLIWRRYAVFAYLSAVFILVFGALLLPELQLKDTIFTSLFVACAIFILAHLYCKDSKYKYLTALLLGFFVYYLFFVGIGRTGQIIFFALYFLFCWQRFGLSIKYNIRALLVLFVLISSILVFPSSFLSRQVLAAVEIKNYEHDKRQSLKSSSLGLRLAFAQNSIQLVKSKPIFGWGTGAFAEAYSHTFSKAHENGSTTVNPHNQYLLSSVELGLFGLVSLLYMFFTLAREFLRQRNFETNLGLGILLAICLGCLANSWLFDFTSMYFFAAFMGVLLPASKHSK